MSLPTSRYAYKDCFEVYDRALEDEQGARVQLPDYDAALFFRMRMNQARKLRREENAQIYEKGDPKHGVSPYDSTVVTIKQHDGAYYVYVQHIGLNLGEIESLSQVESQVQAVIDEQATLVIEGPKAPLMIEQVKRRV